MKDDFQTWESAVSWLKRQPEQQDLVQACFYDDPLTAAAERYLHSTEWEAVRRLLPAPSGRALDVGAGRGISSYALARDGWIVTALEPDPSQEVGAGAIRQLASDTRTDITVVETWGEALPFSDASFDVVHCRQVLHHARDLGQLCSEVARVLKIGGVFIATREHVVSRREDVAAFQASHPLHRLYGGENAFLLEEYTGAIKAAGITLKQVLNPNQSDINLFPQTTRGLKERWAGKVGLPLAGLIPDLALTLAGARSGLPGRLYSFVGEKVSSA